MKNREMFDDFREASMTKKNINYQAFPSFENILQENRYNSYLKMILNEKSHRNGIVLTEE
jgi:hypothetical protein